MAEGKIIIRGEDRISKPLRDIKKSIDDLNGSNLTRLAFSFNQMATAASSAISAFNNVYSVATDMTSEFGESEKVSLRMQAVWKNVGDTLSYSAKDIQEYADELERLTYFSGEDILEAQKLLAATEKLTDEGFARAREASADLASAMGTTMASAAQTLSKALAEPTSSLKSLRSVGITFNDIEKERIKNLEESNQLNEAQAIILDKVAKRYAGVAEAMHDTETGTLDSINTSLSNIRKNLGGELLDVISPALEQIYGWLYKIENWAGQKTTTAQILRGASRGMMSFELSSSYSKEALQAAYDQALENKSTAMQMIDAARINEYLDESTYLADYDDAVKQIETLHYAIRQLELAEKDSIDGFQRGSLILNEEFKPAISVISQLVDDNAEKLDEVNEYISKNKNMSKEAMKAYYEAQKEQARLYRDQEGITENQIKQIDEIISSYDKLIEKLDETTEATEKNGKSFEDYFHNISGAINNVTDKVTDFYESMYTSKAENLEKQLDAEKEAGTLTLDEQEKLQEEINKLKEKAFEADKANSITQTTISGIEAAMNAYKALAGLGPTGVALGAAAASIIGTYTAAQVAQISSQKYTAMATGGVVTNGPVHALIGEAGPEAVIPLNNAKSRELLEGNDSGVININITIEGNADEEKIFSAIERAQRTGVLPRWKYAI